MVEESQHALDRLHAGMLTMDGRCKTLDATADGYVRAETCIVLLLQSAMGSDLTDNIVDCSNTIYMKGTFVNQVISFSIVSRSSFCS